LSGEVTLTVGLLAKNTFVGDTFFGHTFFGGS